MKLLLGSTALAVGLSLSAYLSAPAAAQQYACDADGDGFVDATEARSCTERTFDELGAGAAELTEEHLGAMGQEGGVPPTFGDVDENGDGVISREEWVGFSDRRFAGATEASEGRMSAEDYTNWRGQGMQR